jgi:hypothetical protein
LCVGHASYDLIFTVDTHPASDEKVFANDFLACGGGPAANAAVQIAKLGGYVHFTEYEITCRSHIVQFAKLNVEKSDSPYKPVQVIKSIRYKNQNGTEFF